MARIKSDLEKCFEEIYEKVRQQAKKEVFDDIEPNISFDGSVSLINESVYWRLKHKHLLSEQ